MNFLYHSKIRNLAIDCQSRCYVEALWILLIKCRPFCSLLPPNQVGLYSLLAWRHLRAFVLLHLRVLPGSELEARFANKLMKATLCQHCHLAVSNHLLSCRRHTTMIDRSSHLRTSRNCHASPVHTRTIQFSLQTRRFLWAFLL